MGVKHGLYPGRLLYCRPHLSGLLAANGLLMSAAPSRTLSVERDHPALPGHFPGAPVVPGVVLLSHVLSEVATQLPQIRVNGIKKLKFLRMLFPAQTFSVELAAPTVGSLRFKCWQNGALLAEGNLSIHTELSHVDVAEQPV